MGRATIIVRNQADKDRASAWAQKAPVGTRIEFKATKRTLPQNDRMWAMLTDIATQLEWNGYRLSPDDWKLMFLDALNREVRVVSAINGDGFVTLGRSSSDLSKEEMSDMIELMTAFGAQHGVTFHDQGAV